MFYINHVSKNKLKDKKQEKEKEKNTVLLTNQKKMNVEKVTKICYYEAKKFINKIIESCLVSIRDVLHCQQC